MPVPGGRGTRRSRSSPLADDDVAVGSTALDVVNGIADLLNAPAPLVLAFVFALLALLARDWKVGVGTLVGMALIISMEQWENAMDTLALIVVATVVALVIAIPLGILAARSDGSAG